MSFAFLATFLKELIHQGGIWIWVAVGVVVMCIMGYFIIKIGEIASEFLNEKAETEREYRKQLINELKNWREGAETSQRQQAEFQNGTVRALEALETSCKEGFHRNEEDNEKTHEDLNGIKGDFKHISGWIEGHG